MRFFRLSTALLSLAMFTAEATAQHTFDFVSEGNVEATLVLAKIPATQDDFASLTFHFVGGGLFRFGESYSGTFDEMSGPGAQFIGSLNGGLSGSDDEGNDFAFMRDFNPPDFENGFNTSLPDGATVLSFDVYASIFDNSAQVEDPSQFNSLDRMQLNYMRADGSESSFGTTGFWQPVPEPSSNVILWLAICMLGYNRRVLLGDLMCGKQRA